MNKYRTKNLASINGNKPRNPYLLVSRPESLNIDTMLSPSLRHRVDDALYLISLLIFKAAHGMVNAAGYTNLNFDILAQIMDNRTLGPVKQSLIENEVIQCDGIYIPAIKSLGFRLHPRFCNDTVITSIIKNPRICRTLDRYYVKKLAESKALWLPVHYELNKHQHMIEIDMDQANEIIKKLEPNVKRKPQAGNAHELITRRTKLAQSSLCESIRNKCNVIKVGTTRRLYNCVTSLSSELRPALRYKGEQCESSDIRNSQPALLSKLVEDHLASGKGYPSNMEVGNRKNASHIGMHCLDRNGPGCYLLEDRNQEQKQEPGHKEPGHKEPGHRKPGYLYGLRLPDDFILYSELTANGEFYDFMLEKVQLAGYRCQKDAVKEKFLTDIFAKKKWVETKSGLIVNCDYDSVVEEVFRDWFPTVSEFIYDTNKTDPANGVTFWNKHAVLIRLLQQTEAKLVIEDAAQIALAHRSKPLVLTCHDAFFCGAGEAAILDECLMAAASSQGHRFKTKTEYFR